MRLSILWGKAGKKDPRNWETEGDCERSNKGFQFFAIKYEMKNSYLLINAFETVGYLESIMSRLYNSIWIQ